MRREVVWAFDFTLMRASAAPSGKSSGCGRSEMRTDVGARGWIVGTDWSDVDTCTRELKKNGF